MRWPLVWRSRHEDELADAKAEITRQRKRVQAAEERAKTAERNQQSIARNQGVLLDQYRHVINRNRALCTQLEAAQVANGFDRAAAQKTADRIKRLREAVAKARGEAATETRRADLLQSRLDDAVGLNHPAVAAGDGWQARRQQRMTFDKPTTAEEATA